MAPRAEQNPRESQAARRPHFWLTFRQHFYEVLCIVLLAVALLFFWQAIAYLMQRDYPATLLLGGVGLSVAHLAGLMARLALADRS
jgi:hypothetical protein